MFRFVLILSLTAMVFASSGAKKLLAAQMDAPAAQAVVMAQIDAAADHVDAECCEEAIDDEHATGDKCHQTVAVLSAAPLVKDRWSKSKPMSVDSERLTGYPSKLLKRPPRHIS